MARTKGTDGKGKGDGKAAKASEYKGKGDGKASDYKGKGKSGGDRGGDLWAPEYKAKGDGKASDYKGKGKSGGDRGGDSWGKGGGSGEKGTSLFAGKEYKDGLEELTRKTSARVNDIDNKALQLLDFLHQRGKAKEACAYLKKTLEGTSRDQVSNWRAYIYTLLRGYDEEAYEAMKGGTCSARRPRGERKDKSLADKIKGFRWNTEAAEFTPGVQWSIPTVPPTIVAEGTIANTDTTGEATAETTTADAPAEAEKA